MRLVQVNPANLPTLSRPKLVTSSPGSTPPPCRTWWCAPASASATTCPSRALPSPWSSGPSTIWWLLPTSTSTSLPPAVRPLWTSSSPRGPTPASTPWRSAMSWARLWPEQPSRCWTDRHLQMVLSGCQVNQINTHFLQQFSSSLQIFCEISSFPSNFSSGLIFCVK